MRFLHDNRILRERRRELRKSSTKAEQILWFELRNRKLGVKFKRQHSIGGYIADFYCQECKLVIELDGEIHDTKENKDYDKIRDSFFESFGYKVLRIPNKEAEENVEKVLEEVKNYF